MVALEPWGPLHDSLCWQLHDAYFGARGIEAWESGEVPHEATSNFGIACQHARFLAALVAQAAPDAAEIWVMEIGAGLGRFVERLLRALDTEPAAVEARLGQRVRVVLSDYSRRSVEQAAVAPHLRAEVAAGRVVPALHDVRGPDLLVDLDGTPLPSRLLAVYANYLCCVLPPRNLQRRGDVWRGQQARLEAEPSSTLSVSDLLAEPTREGLLDELTLSLRWRAASLAELLPDCHARIAAAAVAGLDEATLSYPLPFADYLLGAAPLLADGGVFVVNDYGRVDRRRFAGLSERKPQIYGNSLAYEVEFPVLGALAGSEGWGFLCTEDPVRNLHTALLRPSGSFPAPLEAAFATHHRDSHPGEDLVDFYDVAKELADEEPDRAARLLRRCIELDPHTALYRYRLADTLTDAGHYEAAMAEAVAGLGVPGAEEHDFAFVLGRACCLADRFADAIAWYERSLASDEHHVTLTNLAVLYEHFGRFADARRALERAIDLAPDYKKARTRLAKLAERAA